MNKHNACWGMSKWEQSAHIRRKVCLSLFTYCSPASWPQSQSEVSVESAGAWGEEEERQTLKASREKAERERERERGQHRKEKENNSNAGAKERRDGKTPRHKRQFSHWPRRHFRLGSSMAHCRPLAPARTSCQSVEIDAESAIGCLNCGKINHPAVQLAPPLRP